MTSQSTIQLINRIELAMQRQLQLKREQIAILNTFPLYVDNLKAINKRIIDKTYLKK